MTASTTPITKIQPPDHPGPCVHFAPATLHRSLDAALAEAGLDTPLRTTHPHLFSDTSIFITPADLGKMRAVIAAVEEVVALSAYRDAALAAAPSIAGHDPRTPGVFLGYDFHLDPDGPRLIEINTNAGGALLSIALLRAHLKCCTPLLDRLPGTGLPASIETAFVDMFRREWRAARGNTALGRIAIVDDEPGRQFLHPEFVLFRTLFGRHGFETVIGDAAALELRDDRLTLAGEPVDLVYNRLTDFSLDDPRYAALRTAYLGDRAVVTPHPRAHALYADKRNLATLTDTDWLRSAGVTPSTIETLTHGIARTIAVDPAHADSLWARRKKLFFKPAAGYGSRAVYRGDKLTRRVWDEILAGGYVAQALVSPSEQAVTVNDQTSTLKFDVRNVVYAGAVQLVSARLYQGQTTNLRTPGGGFAPVFTTAPAG